MITGPGDTVGVASDTLFLPALQSEFSIGRIIPLMTAEEGLKETTASEGIFGTASVSDAGRIDGQPLPVETISHDFSFILLSLSLLIITALTVSGRKSIISWFSSISFRKRPDLIPPGTTAVLAWPKIMRNVFTILNISLFAVVSLLSADLLNYNDPYSFVELTAILSGAFLAAMMARHLMCIIVAEITGWKSLFREYMVNVYNIWFATAVFLFFLNGIIIFAPLENTLPLIITGLIISVMFLIIREIRLLLIFHNSHISVFYFILYLCALEVLPVLVTMKILGIF